MTRHHVWIALTGLAIGLATVGCDPQAERPPESLSELRKHETLRKPEYTGQTISLHNVRRVLADDLPVADRMESLKVLDTLKVDDTDARAALDEARGHQKFPPELAQAVAAYLGTPSAVSAVTATQASLAEVIKQWAATPETAARQELLYRQTVERMTGKKWEQALLDGLNQTERFPRGSALEVLVGRMRVPMLAQKVNALVPRTAAVLSMQNFSRQFLYLPKTRSELLACVIVSRQGRSKMRAASQLAGKWRVADKYTFNVRDFHLLVGLSSDPLRDSNMTRAKLTPAISRSIAGRRKAAGAGAPIGPRRDVFRLGRLIDFDSQVENFSMADLWNLHLLDEMLRQPRVRRMLSVTARQDRGDRATQWGGLIAYESGRAEAKLYWPAEKRGDDAYVPSRKMLLEAPGSLMYFVGHFDKDATTSALVGPTKAELDFAKVNNLYGVVLTSVGPKKINAAYFNIRGFVVDLGDFDTP